MPRQHADFVIEARGLEKRYGNTVAVDGVDLSVVRGEIFGILGPNGAGKTTTLEMLEGLRIPDSGTATLDRYDIVDNVTEIRKVIGVQLQTTSLFDYLTAAELIVLFAGLYEVDSSKERITELLATVDLEEKRDSRVDQMSGGQQQRLSIALALVNDPVVAFMDEPTTGLDPGARRELWQALREMRDRGTTIVLTTHYMEEAEILCDRVAVMDFGKIIALDTPRGLIRDLGSVARIEADCAIGALSESDLHGLAAVTDVAATNGHIELRTSDAQRTLTELLRLSQQSGIELTDLRSTQASLEDVFLDLTGRSYAADEDEPPEESPDALRKKGLLRR